MARAKTHPCLDLWLVAACWTLVISRVAPLEDAGTLYQRAHYQMRELEKTLRELEASHSIHKRSTDVLVKCNDLIAFVQKMCYNKDTLTKHAPQITDTENDQNNPSKNALQNSQTNAEGSNRNYNHSNKIIDWKHTLPTDLEFYRNSTPPSIFLSKATAAKRKESELRVDFEVVHSMPISVLKHDSLDSQEKAMDSTETIGTDRTGVQWNLSHVAMAFDTSDCWRKNARDDVMVLFRPVEGPSPSPFFTTTVDMCRYGQFYNQSEYVWQNKTTTEPDQESSQIIETPEIKLLPDPGNTMFIERGDNPSIDIETRVTSKIECIVWCQLWDWRSNKTEGEWFSLTLDESSDENPIRVERTTSMDDDGRDPEEHNLQVDILKTTVLNVEEGEERSGGNEKEEEEEERRNKKSVRVTIRVTVNIGSREMSGYLHVYQAWEEREYDKRPVIRRVSANRRILLKLPYKISALPMNYANIHARPIRCDENGNKWDAVAGTNCTIKCQAFGDNIRSIFITRSPYRFPVKSVSYVMKGVSAFVIQDVGPASEQPSDGGEYRCTVVFGNWKTKSQPMSLITKGFTKMTNLTLEDFDNSTSSVACTVYGIRPLNISVYVRDANGTRVSLDAKDAAIKTIQNVDEYTTMLTLLVPTNELQYPTDDHLECTAHGPGGHASTAITQSNFLTIYNPFIPKLSRENSTVVKGSPIPDTTTITCLSTSGGSSVDVMVAYGGRGKRFRIDYNRENTRSIEMRGEATLLTVTVPTKSIGRRYSWLYCGAENEHGEDWVDFNLPYYGIR